MSRFNETEDFGGIKQFDLQSCTPIDNPAKGPKLLFCFLICRPLECPELWRAFFDAAYRDGYEHDIVYHSCKDLPLCLDRCECKLPTVKTSWAQTVNAHYLFAKYASGYDKFIVVSDSCIPVKPPKAVWDMLNNDYTLLTGLNLFAKNRGRVFPKNTWNFWGGHEQWAIIDKQHYGCFTDAAPEIVKALEAIKMADNEHAAHSLIRYAGLADSVRSGLFWKVSWGPYGVNPQFQILDTVRASNSYEIRNHPLRAHQISISESAILAISQHPTVLFARKFHGSCQTAAQIALISSY